MTTAVQLIEHATNLIETKGWTRGVAARRANGAEVSPDDPKACRFCILGALDRARSDLNAQQDACDGALNLLELSLKTGPSWRHPVIRFNDETALSKKEVVNFMKKVIENAA